MRSNSRRFASALVPSILAFGLATAAAAQDFRAPEVVAAGLNTLTTAAAVADMNGDGKTDWIVVNADPAGIDDVRVYLGNGAGGVLTVIPTLSPVAIEPFDLTIADMNKDGLLDIVTLSAVPEKLSVFLGDGTGAVSSIVHKPLPANGPLDLTVADMDGDGFLDAVILDSTPRVRLGFGDGTGAFPLTTSYSALNGATHLAVADLDHDAIPDVTVCNNGQVGVRLGAGGGVLGAELLYAVGGGDSITLGDFNGDTHLDVVTADTPVNAIFVAFGDGLGAFINNYIVPTLAGPVDVALADFNNDKRLDIAVACASVAPLTRAIEYKQGIGNGAFMPSVVFALTGAPGSLVAADVNSDLRVDLVATHPAVSGGFSTLISEGISAYSLALYPTVGASPRDVALGDLNADGSLDIVATVNAGNSVTIRLGTSGGTGFGAAASVAAGPAPIGIVLADVNLDGVLDVVTANSAANGVNVLPGDGAGGFLANVASGLGFGPEDVVVADLNLDGIPDAAVASTAGNVMTRGIGNGTGAFGGFTNAAVGNAPMGIIARDFNFDGALDLATANFAANSVTVLIAVTGGYNVNSYAAAGNGTVDLAAEDMNGDGLLDIVSADSLSNGLSRFSGMAGGFGAAVPVTMGMAPHAVVLVDVNNDGVADTVCSNELDHTVSIRLNGGLTQTTVMVGDSPRGLTSGDVNQDGVVDFCVADENGGDVAFLWSTAGFPGTLAAYGTGTTGCDGVITLTAGVAPRLGDSAFGLTCTNVPRRSLGLGLIADVQDVLGFDTFGLGALLHVDLLTATQTYTMDAYSGYGGSSFAKVPIPNNVSLAGMVFYAQTLWVEDAVNGRACSTALAAIVTSKGLTMTIED